MKCQKCGEREATTHVKKVINGYKQEYYLCADCAQEAGLMNFQNMDFGIGNFLSGIFGGDKKLQSGEPEILKGASVCPTCGMRIQEFLDGGKLGCSDCYDAFRGRLVRPLRQIHGACEHVGKVPQRRGGALKRSRQIANLEADLNKAVMEQNFEQAAKLRDQIRDLKNEQKDSEKGA